MSCGDSFDSEYNLDTQSHIDIIVDKARGAVEISSCIMHCSAQWMLGAGSAWVFSSRACKN